MNENYHVCTGCALLCDDIEVVTGSGRITEVKTACRKGVARMKGCSEPMSPTVDGQEVDIDNAIGAAAGILSNARSPLVFGLGNSTNMAQKKAIELAKRIGAVIDDTSSFCQGPTLEAIFNENIRSTTLDDVRNKADVIVYWGADASNSHPRHFSKYSYFPRGQERQRGWEEDRIMITIDIRRSHTAKISGDKFYQIPLQADAEFIDALIDALSGKVPKVSFGFDIKRILELANILKKARFGTIFVGLGLVYSIDNMDPVVKLMDKLNEMSNFHLIPMVGHYNMRGFNQNLFNETGYLNRVKFEKGDSTDVQHGAEFSIVETLNNKAADAALVIGSDPLSSLPRVIAEHLLNIPVITIDPCETFTSRKAKVTIPSALSGVECGGSAIRMDGVEVKFEPIIETNRPPDEEILTRIMEAL
ncbi:MAG TPA: formylmethanofuran dehydrogenase subunit B [Methanosarcinaceae archaeon]|nr:formylmethanofuran dehydrogenase subunit B [Methanosarcinaceae archaeon]